MQWYFVKFNERELFIKEDNYFVSQFIKLLHELKHPQDLALFGLKFQLDEGIAFYISSPPHTTDKVKNLLSHHLAEEISCPNLKVLQLEVGKSDILNR